MAEGGSFLNPRVGEPSRRAFLDVDKRVKAAQDDAASALAQIAALSPDHGSLLGLGDDDHTQYHNDARGDARYLQLSGGTVTGQTTFSATDGVKLTGPSGGVWWDDRNGDGTKWVMYHSGDMIGLWNGSTTPFEFKENGVGYATNWSVGTGSSANAFVGGSNYWRPQDAYGNSYFDINSGQFYVDSDTYYFRNRASTNSMTINSSGDVYIRGRLDVSGRIYPDNWIQFDEYEGLYSPLNAAHLYPNNGSYGAWRIDGSRGSWHGIEFTSTHFGQLSFMMTATYGENNMGVHRNGSGWLWRFSYQDLYCNSYRGFNNVAGTGNASYHPSGIYSTGTNWLYGTILTNGNDIGQSSQRVGQVWSNGWLRTVNQTGWYNDSYGGGMYMTDSNYVRVYNSKGLQSNKVCSKNYDTASIYINAPNDCSLSFHPGGQAPQIRVGYNNNTFYFRNWPDTGWAVCELVLINHSSRVDKQDISDFANRPSSLSSDGNSEYARSGTDIVRQLRPRHYRWDWDKNMRQLPLSQRRTEALARLNAYREKQGLGEFLNDESWHVCGRDCEGSETDPCWWVKDWQTGYFGFIAEEVGEVAPEAGRLSETTGELSGLDPMAMSAIIVASLQEVLDRLDALEAAGV